MKTLNTDKAVRKYLVENGNGQITFKNISKYNREFVSAITGDTKSTGQLNRFTTEKADALIASLVLSPAELNREMHNLRKSIAEVQQLLCDKIDAGDFTGIDDNEFPQLAVEITRLSGRLEKVEKII